MAPVSLDPEDSAERIPLGLYLFRRIASLGINSIFGVPGDFNLTLLENLYDVPSLKWYGCCNELNASYATDGYSRMINKIGVMITTMGVGEMSALNGIGGAFAEYVPLLHIVGTTPTHDKRAGRSNHHVVTPINPLAPTNHYAYEHIAETVSCRVESISNAESAPDQIDAVIRTILEEKRPGYLYIPCDLAMVPVDPSNLDQRSGSTFYKHNEKDVSTVADKILDKIYNSVNPCILGDILCDRFNVTGALQEFANATRFPNCSTSMGKSLLDESNDFYVGDYIGAESAKQVGSFVRSSDLLLHFGAFLNETNTGHHSLYNGIKDVVVVNPKYTEVDGVKYDAGLQDILPTLLERLDVTRIPKVPKPSVTYAIDPVPSNTPISETDVLQTVQNFIQPDDTVVVETGSLLYGMPDVRLPTKTRVISQPFYLSIGMGLPCSFGVSIARRELGANGRLILIEGDGAAQMTVQELSNYNREGLNPIILLLNNNGYTVERLIKGATRDYNDIRPDWKWTQIFDTFGMKDYKCKRVTEPEDLNSSLDEFGSHQCPRLIEVVLDKMDVPWRFHGMLQGSQ